MKIIIIDPIGTESMAMYDWALCESLSQSKNEVILVSCPEYEYKERMSHFDIKLILSGYRRNNKSSIVKLCYYFIANIKLYKFILTERPDIVHYQFIGLPIIDYLFISLIKIKHKIIFTVHDVKVTTGSKIKNMFLKDCIKLFNGVQVHSRESLNLLNQHIPKLQGSIAIIPHGNFNPLIQQYQNINLNKLLLKSAYLHGVNPKAKILAFIGSILDYKGIDILIKSYAILKEHNENIHLVIAGYTRNASFEKYNVLLEQLKIKDRTTLLIKYLSEKEIVELLSLTDLVALPYRECYTPGVAHLCMSLGTPIIASNVGAFSSVIIDKETGVLVDSDNEMVWSEKINQVIFNDELLNRLSINAKNNMLINHAWDRVASLTKLFYKNVLKTN